MKSLRETGRYPLLAGALAALALATPASRSAPPPASTLVLHVDAAAADGGDGSGRWPYNSIGLAVDAARSRAGDYSKVAINVAPGEYVVSSTIDIDFPVELRGANVPDVDENQWPLGTVLPGTATFVYGSSSLGNGPVIFVHPTSAESVSGVTIRNLRVQARKNPLPPSPSGAPQFTTGETVKIQKAQDFAVKNLIVGGPGFTGIDVSASSGVVSGNHVSGVGACGICIAAGTASSPASVTATDNRSVANAAGGLLLSGTTFPLLEVGGFLNARIVHNDLSRNRAVTQGFGIRVFAIGSQVPLSQRDGRVTAELVGNRLADNRYALIVDAGFPRRNRLPLTTMECAEPEREFTGQLTLTLSDNAIGPNVVSPALVTFTRSLVFTANNAANSPAAYQYLHEARFAIDDPALSLGGPSGFRIDHPESDPFVGGYCPADAASELLLNRFIYNGSEVPFGRNFAP